MAKSVNTKKMIFLFSQLAAVLAIAITFLLFQIGAFAGPSPRTPAEQSIENSELPVILISPTPTRALETTDPQAPPAGEGNNTGGNGISPADQACQDFMKSNWDAINAVSSQAWQLWDQQLALESAAASTSDPIEAESLWAQAAAIGAEHTRLNNQAIQMQNDFFGGHTGMGCGPNGIYYW